MRHPALGHRYRQQRLEGRRRRQFGEPGAVALLAGPLHDAQPALEPGRGLGRIVLAAVEHHRPDGGGAQFHQGRQQFVQERQLGQDRHEGGDGEGRFPLFQERRHQARQRALLAQFRKVGPPPVTVQHQLQGRARRQPQHPQMPGLGRIQLHLQPGAGRAGLGNEETREAHGGFRCGQVRSTIPQAPPGR